MESAVHVVTPHSSDSLRAVPNAQTLAASAVYQLSETGRKASLLAGGDGKAVQRLSVQVPATRLHLVTVGLGGQAKLKLQPHFERVDGQVVRRDGPPVFDAPPTFVVLSADAGLRSIQPESTQNRQNARRYSSRLAADKGEYVHPWRNARSRSTVRSRSCR